MEGNMEILFVAMGVITPWATGLANVLFDKIADEQFRKATISLATLVVSFGMVFGVSRVFLPDMGLLEMFGYALAADKVGNLTYRGTKIVKNANGNGV